MLHEFTLVVEPGVLDTDEAVYALFDAGCDDCEIRRTRHHGVYLQFARESEASREHTIRHAIAQVYKVPGMRLRRVEDTIVGRKY